MLHERRLPQPEFDDLNLVYQVKLRLLDWLLRTPPARLDNQVPLIAKFGQPVGDWLWDRIFWQGKETTFGKAVMALAAKASAAPAEAKAVADAIALDAQFHTKWDAVGFEFQFPRLHPPEWLKLVCDVSEPFYDWLGSSSGFDSKIFGLPKGNMTRARLMDAFRTQFKLVCGYCDGPLGDCGTKSEANDCDHFFPKSQWPHLAIHPANLYSACMGCNSRWKLAKKPMGAADVSGLEGTYHPMLRPGASLISVKATQAPSNSSKVTITISDSTFSSRAKTLNETLDLEARWANFVNDKLDEGVSVFVAKTVKDRCRGLPPTSQSVSELIQDDIAWQRKRIGKDERTLRQVAVLEYQLANSLPAILADLS